MAIPTEDGMDSLVDSDSAEFFEFEMFPVWRRCIRQNSGVVEEEFDDECACSGVFASVKFVLDEDVRLSIDAFDFALNE
jgi:hypothetical protein